MDDLLIGFVRCVAGGNQVGPNGRLQLSSRDHTVYPDLDGVMTHPLAGRRRRVARAAHVHAGFLGSGNNKFRLAVARARWHLGG